MGATLLRPAAVPADAGLSRWLLLAVLLTGVGWVALLPPWEGFDEGTHYSYIQQIADTGAFPRHGEGRVSTDVERYAAVAPYAAGARTPYHEFFRHPDFAAARDLLRAPPAEPRRFAEGAGANYQAQHPPLYYALLAPLYAATRDWSWVSQLFLLRTVSWLLAFGGLAIGVRATLRHLPEIGDAAAGGAARAARVMAAWPFLFPMFFPEMARLGNDSLCLLLAGTAWALLLRGIRDGDRPRDYAGLGIVLGLGLLTKAFFVGIAAGAALFVALRLFGQWRAGAPAPRLRRLALGLAAVAALPWALGGAWYLYQLLAHGAVTGSLEQIMIKAYGGLVAGLADTFTPALFLRGIATVFGTFMWGGSGSLARLPEIFHAPLLLLEFLVFGTYLWLLLRARAGDLAWAPLLLAGPVFAGLCYHVLMRIVLSGHGVGTLGTPGWYLHIVAVPLAFAAALALRRLLDHRAGRPLVLALAAYTYAYFLVATLFQLLFYSGCVLKDPASKHFAFPAGPACDAGTVLERLAFLGLPWLGLPLLALGFALGGYGLWRGLARNP
jgi:hypothetical protein